MFQFRGFPSYTYVFSIRCRISIPAGFPIRKSAGLWIFAPNRSLSQLVTSFVGSWCQVILPTLLLAWPSKGKLRLRLQRVADLSAMRHYKFRLSIGSLNYIRIRDCLLCFFNLLKIFLKLKFPLRKNHIVFIWSVFHLGLLVILHDFLVFFSLSSFVLFSFQGTMFNIDRLDLY